MKKEKEKEQKVKSPLLNGNRETNFEIYRIVLMLLIFAHHYVVNSGLTAADGPIAYDITAKRALLYLTVGAWGPSALNGFALISGFFMYNRQLSGKKYVRLLAEVMFYRLLFAAAFWVAGYEAFSLNALVKALIPVTNAKDSEIQAVLIVYLSIPILNRISEALSERMYVGLLVLAGFTYTLCGSFRFMTVAVDYVVWFAVMYLLGAYIGRYPKKRYDRASVWGLLLFISLAVSFATILNCINRRISVYTYMDAPYKLMPLLNGLTSFLFFRRLKLRKSRVINLIASATFGVMLIHTAGAPMRKLLWVDLLKVKSFYWASAPVMLLHIVGGIAAVYIACTVIDLLRAWFLERPFVALLGKIGPVLRARWEQSLRRMEKKN